MRFLTFLLLTPVASIACADQLIDIPTARKVVFEDFRYEFRVQPISGGDIQNYLGLGIGKAFELDVRDVHNAGKRPVGTFDLSYNLLPALPGGEVPGVSIGVQDASNLTTDGRRYYLVSTFRNAMDEIGNNAYSDITIGFQFGSLTSPFVGISTPFTQKLSLIAEHSGFRLSAGFEYRPTPKIVFRVIDRDRKTLLSLSASARF